MVYVGQMEAYGKGVEVLQKLAGVETNDAQLYRVADTYGSLLEPLGESPAEPVVPIEAAVVEDKEVVYAEVDGSMVFTDDGWREVKLGRVFRASACKKSSDPNRNGCIAEGEYSAFLGHFNGFADRFEPVLSPYEHLGKRLVFLTDGALWIRNWISQAYPNALQILDFFHVKEHLAKFAQCAQPEPVKRKSWLAQQCERLKQGKLDVVVADVQSFTLPLPSARDEQANLTAYLKSNEDRMQYNRYLEAGLFIGPGAIEAAHQTVIQGRMKKSGQRWTAEGAQNMLNLRVAHKSNQWGKVVKLIHSAVAKAA